MNDCRGENGLRNEKKERKTEVMKVVIHETGQGSGREEGEVDMWMGYYVCEWMDG